MHLRAALFGLLTFCLLHATVSVKAQTVTARPDSAVVAAPKPNPDADRIVKTEKDKGLSKPGRAALYSAVLPGAGQFYNKHYWKVPVVYLVLGGMGYLVVSNDQKYKDYQLAYKYSVDPEDAGTTPAIAGSSAFLRTSRDFHRRNRDLTIIISVLAYGLQIMEANVGAHLNEFDISDDLSLNWQPNLRFSGIDQKPAAGLTLNFRLKN